MDPHASGPPSAALPHYPPPTAPTTAWLRLSSPGRHVRAALHHAAAYQVVHSAGRSRRACQGGVWAGMVNYDTSGPVTPAHVHAPAAHTCCSTCDALMTHGSVPAHMLPAWCALVRLTPARHAPLSKDGAAKRLTCSSGWSAGELARGWASRSTNEESANSGLRLSSDVSVRASCDTGRETTRASAGREIRRTD